MFYVPAFRAFFETSVSASWEQLGVSGRQRVRDLWRQNNLPDVNATGGVLKMTIPIHGVMLYKLTAAAARNSGT